MALASPVKESFEPQRSCDSQVENQWPRVSKTLYSTLSTEGKKDIGGIYFSRVENESLKYKLNSHVDKDKCITMIDNFCTGELLYDED